MRFSSAFAAVIGSTCLFASLPASAAFSRGPWVQNADATSITLAWEAGFLAGPTEEVDWGVGSATDQVLQGTLLSGSVYTATITGLSPSTQYSYVVKSGSDTSTAVGVVTAPASGEPFRFVAYGDNRTDATAHAAVVSAIVSKNPDFVVNTGDMAALPIYNEFFQIEAPLVSRTPIFPCPGNHDTSTTAYTVAGFDRPAWYSYRWGNAFFVSISTDDDYSQGSTQYQWIESQLQAAKADPTIDWIFAQHHYPMYSSSTHGSTPGMESTLGALYQQYGVDAVFNGHDHDYERSEQNGVVYLVVGGGGAPLYPAGTSATGHVFSDSVNSFVTADVDGKTLTLTAWDTSGNAIDSRVIDKSATGPTPTPTPGGTPTPNPTGTPGGDGANGGAHGCSIAQLDGQATGLLGAALLGLAVVATVSRRRRA